MIINNIFFLAYNLMSIKKVYSYEDLNKFSRELIKLIHNELKKLNTNNSIIYPTEQRYEELSENAAKKLTNTDRCLGIYLTGKNKGKRCQASPYADSKYCLKHITQDPINKRTHEEEIKHLRESIESLKNQLDNQQSEK